MTDYINTINVGLHLSSPKVLIPWGESKERVLSNFSSDSITNSSDRFYSIKGSLLDGGLNCSIIMQFSKESKLIAIGIVNENNDGSEESAKCSFEEVQEILEKYFGKPSKPPILTQFFTKMNKGDKEYRWHFKNITVVHKLWDRFGLEENIEILCN